VIYIAVQNDYKDISLFITGVCSSSTVMVSKLA